MTKRLLAVALVAAASSVAAYIYVQKKKEAKRKNVPMNFV